MNSFFENCKYVQNEFEEARWDESTGLSPEAIAAGLEEIKNAHADQRGRNRGQQIHDHSSFSVSSQSRKSLKPEHRAGDGNKHRRRRYAHQRGDKQTLHRAQQIGTHPLHNCIGQYLPKQEGGDQ